MSLRFSLKYSGQTRASIAVYPELLFLYYPHIGKDALVLWLFFAMQAKELIQTDTNTVAQQVGLSLPQFDEALARLMQFGLITIESLEGGDQAFVIHDPLPEAEFRAIFPAEEAASQEPEPVQTPQLAPIIPPQTATDPFGDLLRYYEEQVGWITAKICEDLARWVDDGLEPAVIKEAISEMMQKADSPRYPYLNAILVSWHKNGWYSAQDLQKARAKKESFQGVPNAAAYRELDSNDLERIRRWKELYPDEYDA